MSDISTEKVTQATPSNTAYLFSIAFLFLFAVHYYQPNGGGHGLSLPLNNVIWIGISLVISLGFWRIAQTRKLYFSFLEQIICIGFVGLLLPLVWAESPWRDTVYSRYLGLGSIILLMLSHRQFQLNKKEQQSFWTLISASVLIQCGIGIIQFFHTGDWAIVRDGRPPGTFQQVNVYASFLATGFAISFYQLASQPLTWPKKVLHLLVIFSVALMQVLVFSRTGLLSFIIVLAAFIILYRHNARSIILVLVLVVFGVLTAVALQKVTAVEGRPVESVSKPGYRLTQYKLSWQLIKQSPFLGHGLGKFQTVYLEQQAKAYSDDRISSTHGSGASSHPHNELLFWWVEAGILPVVLFILGGLVLTALVWRQPEKKYKAYWLFLLPVILHTQTEYPLYHSAIHLVLVSLITAHIFMGGIKTYSVNLVFFCKALAVVLVTFTSAFMLTNLHSIYLLGRYAKTTDSSYLISIKNQSGIRSQFNRFMSLELSKTKSPDALSISEAILKQELTLRPSEGAYVYYYETLIFLGKTPEARQVYHKAQYLFPESDYFFKKK